MYLYENKRNQTIRPHTFSNFKKIDHNIEYVYLSYSVDIHYMCLSHSVHIVYEYLSTFCQKTPYYTAIHVLF